MLYDSLEKQDFSKLVNYTRRIQRNALVQRLGFALKTQAKSASGILDSGS